MKSGTGTKFRATNTKSPMKATKVGIIDDDSKPAADPDVYFDTLPEPFNFIDE